MSKKTYKEIEKEFSEKLIEFLHSQIGQEECCLCPTGTQCITCPCPCHQTERKVPEKLPLFKSTVEIPKEFAVGRTRFDVIEERLNEIIDYLNLIK